MAKRQPQTDLWIPPSYLPTTDEISRAYERWAQDRSAREGVSVQAIKAMGIAARQDVWPAHADPSDIEKFR